MFDEEDEAEDDEAGRIWCNITIYQLLLHEQ